MTGHSEYDSDTMRVNYSDGVKTYLVFDESGAQTEAKVEYEDGVGRIQFLSVDRLLWQDEQEYEQLQDMVFEKH